MVQVSTRGVGTSNLHSWGVGGGELYIVYKTRSSHFPEYIRRIELFLFQKNDVNGEKFA